VTGAELATKLRAIADAVEPLRGDFFAVQLQLHEPQEGGSGIYVQIRPFGDFVLAVGRDRIREYPSASGRYTNWRAELCEGVDLLCATMREADRG